MCGIAGIIKYPDLSPATIETMISRIKHRGPDYTGYYSDNFIDLAHARLSIIDLSNKSNQPFYSDDGRYVMIYNGEVYNFNELKQEMNYQPKTDGDTEIVLECFIRFGNSFVNKLNGMFAIAIYDTVKKELILWRDRFGIKPLYYYWDGLRFAFASELKSLTCLSFPKELDKSAIHDYFFLEYIPQPKTIFTNYFKLGNGESLTFKNGEIKVEKYYNILDKINPIENINENNALSEFEELFEKSLKYRQISDVSLGAFLSGGTDSSAVCVGLSKQNQDTSSFNIGFENSQFNESKEAKSVASILNMNHHAHQFKASEILDSWDTIFDQFDEPFAVSSVFPTFKVSELAKKNITVALSGDGGDELFMGYGHYNWYNRLKNLDSSMGKAVRYGLASILRQLPSRYARLSHLLEYNNLKNDWPHIWSQEQYMFSDKEITKLTGQSKNNSTLKASWRDINKVTNDPMLQLSLFDFQNYLTDDLLYKVDMASMRNSLEVRLPFLDHNLVEMVMNLPTKLKINNGEQKYLLKKYLARKLPHELVYKKKWGFGAPIQDWLNTELKDVAHEYLNSERIKSQGILNPDYVEKLWQQFNNGHSYLHKRIWSIITLGIWLDKHYINDN